MSGSYLPEIDDPTLKRVLLEPDSGFLASLDRQTFERLGLDRALLIASDIALRQGTASSFAVLDAGANNGLVGRALGVLGNRITCLDSGIVDSQNCYEHLQSQTVVRADLRDYLAAHPGETWDFVLLLSVVHHWETGYAMSGQPLYTEEQIRRIFETLHERTRQGIYLELPLAEPGFTPDFSDAFVKKYASSFSIIEINRTIGSNGYLRRLFYLDRSGKNLSPETERILRNAHLYEKLETQRLTVPRGEVYRMTAGKKTGV